MKWLREVRPIAKKAMRAIDEVAYKMGLKKGNRQGTFGRILFETSTMKIETLHSLKRSAKARYATHEIVGLKSRLEFVGNEPDEITFTMQLHTDLGVDVGEELTKLIEMLRNGEAYHLVLGEHAYGQNKWVLTAMTVDQKYADKKGKPYYAEVDVTLREYME